MADFTNVEVTDTFDQWRIKTNQLGSDFIAFEAQAAEDIANIDLSDLVTKSGDETISGSKTFTSISTFNGQVNVQGNIISGYLDNGVETYGIDLGIGKTSNAQSFIDFNGTGGDGDHAARIWRRDNGNFEIIQTGAAPLFLSAGDGANIELYSKSNSGSPGYAYYDADRHYFRKANGTGNNVLIDSGNVTANDITTNSLNIPGTSSTNKLTIASGKMKLRSLDYTWPSGRSGGTYLRTDANGNLSWAAVAGGTGDVNVSTLVFNDIVPVGTIMPWAGDSLPADGKWKFCNGEEVSKIAYRELTTILGGNSPKYGTASNPATMIKLPNLEQKVPVGAGGTFNLGKTGGGISSSISGSTGETTLTAAQSGLPAHTHNTPAGMLTGNYQGGAQGYDGGGYYSPIGNPSRTTTSASADATAAHSHSLSGSVSTLQPYLVIKYIIKVLPDDVQQVSIEAGNGINVKDALNVDTDTLDLFSTEIELLVDTTQFKFNTGGQLQLVTPVVSQASITNQINTAVSGLATEAYVDSASNFTPSTYAGGESVTLPNGLIMKFGVATGPTTQIAITITFADPFPNGIISAQATATNTSAGNGATYDYWYQIVNQSLKTSVSIMPQGAYQNPPVHNVNWMVIGY